MSAQIKVSIWIQLPPGSQLIQIFLTGNVVPPEEHGLIISKGSCVLHHHSTQGWRSWEAAAKSLLCYNIFNLAAVSGLFKEWRYKIAGTRVRETSKIKREMKERIGKKCKSVSLNIMYNGQMGKHILSWCVCLFCGQSLIIYLRLVSNWHSCLLLLLSTGIIGHHLAVPFLLKDSL